MIVLMGGCASGLSELAVTRAQGSALVHLRFSAPGLSDAPEVLVTLCGEPARTPPPTDRYHVAGCLPCAEHALEAGAHTVQDSDNAWISLRRFRFNAGVRAQACLAPASGRIA